ncbi:hypothetical protein EVAR_44464_1 [Eumeta japonica]|uniref:Uncharacterized protein n=1 Tax=Eumeta variegata TaxID=151549 RepID=A0A4C1WMF6_EUMVA|nr:hypothetical protein EVAR_44464_1 [Eumeta japonica]
MTRLLVQFYSSYRGNNFDKRYRSTVNLLCDFVCISNYAAHAPIPGDHHATTGETAAPLVGVAPPSLDQSPHATLSPVVLR